LSASARLPLAVGAGAASDSRPDPEAKVTADALVAQAEVGAPRWLR
jgi:hypothetical protein